MTTATAVSTAAKIPLASDSALTARMNISMEAGPPSRKTAIGRPGAGRLPDVLFHGKRRVDQLLAVGDFARELLVRGLLRDLDPGVVLGRGQRRHLDIVLLEGRDHVVIEPFRRL